MTITATIRNYRRVERADITIAPIALVAGLNGAGKTSTLQAIQAALLRQPVVVPGGTIKAAEHFVTRGADHGSVGIGIGEETVTVHWPSCKMTSTDAAPACSLVAAGVLSVLDLGDKERAAAIARYAGSAPSATDIALAATDIGYNAAAIEKLTAALAVEGWDVAHKKAAEAGTKLKGQWEGVTGEKWGDKKAATWAPKDWNEDLASTDLRELEMDEIAAQQAIERAIRAGAISVADLDALRQTVQAGADAGLDDIRTKLNAAHDALRQAKEERAGLPPSGDAGIPCPSCGTHLVVDQPWASGEPPALKVAEQIAPKVRKERALQRASLDGQVSRLEGEVKTLSAALARAEHAVERAEEAQAKINAAGGAAGGDDIIAAAKADLAAIQAKRKAIEAYQSARSIYATWAKNAKLVDMLAPDGLRKRVMLKALDDLNAKLAAASAAAGWQPVRIDEALSAHLGAEPYWLLSESMQFRVRVTIQAVFASIDRSAVVIIDRADILDQRGRNGLFGMLRDLAIPAVVGMTLSKRDLVPDLAKAGIGRSYWIEDGAAQEVAA